MKLYRIILLYLVIALSLSLFGCHEFKREGLNHYLDRQDDSQVELTSLFLYSPTFLQEYEYVNGDYHYYDTGDFGKNDYEVAIIHLTYEPNVYEQAKQCIFENTEFVSEDPESSFNGYDFYRINIRLDWENWFVMNVFNDELNTVLAIGFYTAYPTPEYLNLVQNDWQGFLDTYFGEYYDFSVSKELESP